MTFQDGTVVTADGRRLRYREWGDRGHHPTVALFHGSPSCRTLPLGTPAMLESLEVHLLAVDRPGYGGSDFQDARRVPDWAADVLALVDHLGIDHLAVAGISAGAPYAYVCGAQLSGRVVAVAGIATLVPPSWYPGDALVKLAQQDPGAAITQALEMMERRSGDVDGEVDRLIDAATERERSNFAAHRGAFIQARRGAFAQGPRGPAHELVLLNSDWGFEPTDVPVPVTLWHGDRDPVTPLPLVERLAGELPDAALQVVRGAGHAVGFACPADILADLRAHLG